MPIVNQDPSAPNVSLWQGVEELPRDRARLFFVDHYDVLEEEERALRGKADIVVTIDDLAVRHFACDVLLNQNSGFRRRDYDHRVSARTDLLIGPRYALLRPEFSDSSGEASGSTGSRNQRLFVGFGGTDPIDLTHRIVTSLGVIQDRTLEVDVVVGAAYRRVERLQALARQSGHLVNVHVATNDVASLMARCDLAIGAGGTMSWERCAVGLPVLLINFADNQDAVGRALAESEAGVFLGTSARVSNDDIVQAIIALLDNSECRARMRDAARRLCDGRGVERVRARLTSKMLGGAVDVRMLEDIDREVTRTWGFPGCVSTRERISESEGERHYSWLVSENDEPVSTVEVQCPSSDPDTCEVVVGIAPEANQSEVFSTICALIQNTIPRCHKLRISSEAQNDSALRDAGFEASRRDIDGASCYEMMLI